MIAGEVLNTGKETPCCLYSPLNSFFLARIGTGQDLVDAEPD